MDQQTTNRIEIIKAITISILTVGSVLALVLLAAFRDGDFAHLAVQQLPVIIGGGLAVLGAAIVTGGVVSIFQTKYTSQAGAATTISQNQTQAQTQIATVQAQANATNGTAPAPTAEPKAGA